MSVIGKIVGGRKFPDTSAGTAAHERADDRHPARPPREHPVRRVVVGVDGSPNSAAAFQRAAAQARQRNAVLDVVYVLPPGADATAETVARVMLGQFTRRQCPYGVGAPMRLRIEHGDPQTVLLVVSAGAELLVVGRDTSPSPGAARLTTAAATVAAATAAAHRPAGQPPGPAIGPLW
jgi:nucleotide-binding universal stress UspA family protein